MIFYYTLLQHSRGLFCKACLIYHQIRTPPGLLRYLRKLRAKSQDMDKGKEIRAERGMGKGG